MKLGSSIMKYRKKSGLTQAQLAKELNVSQPAIGKYESNDRVPSMDKLIKLSELFQHDFVKDYLADIEDSVSEQTKASVRALKDAQEMYQRANLLLGKAEEIQNLWKFVIPGCLEGIGYLWKYDYSVDKWVITNDNNVTKQLDNAKVVELFNYHVKHIKIDLDALMLEEGDVDGNSGKEKAK